MNFPHADRYIHHWVQTEELLPISFSGLSKSFEDDVFVASYVFCATIKTQVRNHDSDAGTNIFYLFNKFGYISSFYWSRAVFGINIYQNRIYSNLAFNTDIEFTYRSRLS